MMCPNCGSNGHLTVHVGTPHGHRWEEHWTCSTCHGDGTITFEHAGRIAEGERRRRDRLDRGLALRAEAIRLGLISRELSDIENGRIL